MVSSAWSVRTWWRLVRDTVRDFLDDGVLTQAAALSFYAMLSMAPLLVMIIALVGAIWGAEAARGEIVGQFRSIMGERAAATVQEIIERAGERKSGGVLASVIGVGVLVFGAMGVFGQLKSALNTVWNVKPREGRPLWSAVRERLLSLAMIVAIAFLLVVSLAVSAGLAAAGTWLGARTGLGPVALALVNLGASLAAFALLFAAMFKILPDARLAWRDVWTGAIATSILFNLGKFLIGRYLGTSATVSVFGAAGSLALILLWLYYSAALILLGAEFTQVHTRWRGATIEPRGHAERASPDEDPAHPRRAEAAERKPTAPNPRASPA